MSWFFQFNILFTYTIVCVCFHIKLKFICNYFYLSNTEINCKSKTATQLKHVNRERNVANYEKKNK